MPYIVKTDGATSGEPIEVRQGILTDIPEDDRSNWRLAVEIAASLSGDDVRTTPYFAIQPDGSVQMRWNVASQEAYWTKMRLKEYAAQKRWEHSQKGVIVAGQKVQTTDASIAKINGALRALEDGTFATVSWKAAGGWVDLDLAAMQGIHAAVSLFIQSCYSAEKSVCDMIDAGTLTEVSQVNSFAWP